MQLSISLAVTTSVSIKIKVIQITVQCMDKIPLLNNYYFHFFKK